MMSTMMPAAAADASSCDSDAHTHARHKASSRFSSPYKPPLPSSSSLPSGEPLSRLSIARSCRRRYAAWTKGAQELCDLTTVADDDHDHDLVGDAKTLSVPPPPVAMRPTAAVVNVSKLPLTSTTLLLPPSPSPPPPPPPPPSSASSSPALPQPHPAPPSLSPMPAASASSAVQQLRGDHPEVQRRLLEILSGATNPVFRLVAMIQRFCREDFDVFSRRQTIYFHILQRYPELAHEETFVELKAEVLRDLFQVIDSEFFGGAVLAVFEYHRRVLHFRVVDEVELPTQAGSFSRSGVDHFISISEPMILGACRTAAPVMVCGCECHSRLEALIRILEHEIAHLIVYTNWLSVPDAHGDQFQAVAYSFFRHTSCTHALPLPRGCAARGKHSADSTGGCGSGAGALVRGCDGGHEVHSCAPSREALRSCIVRGRGAYELSCSSSSSSLSQPPPHQPYSRRPPAAAASSSSSSSSSSSAAPSSSSSSSSAAHIAVSMSTAAVLPKTTLFVAPSHPPMSGGDSDMMLQISPVVFPAPTHSNNCRDTEHHAAVGATPVPVASASSSSAAAVSAFDVDGQHTLSVFDLSTSAAWTAAGDPATTSGISSSTAAASFSMAPAAPAPALSMDVQHSEEVMLFDADTEQLFAFSFV